MNDRRVLWALVASLVIALVFTFAVPAVFGPAEPPSEPPARRQPTVRHEVTKAPPKADKAAASVASRDRAASREPAQRVSGPRPREQLATIVTPEFRAVLSSRGAILKNFLLSDRKYRRNGRPVDLVSTEREKWLPLRLSFRSSDFEYQDQDVDYQLVQSDARRAVFEWSNGQARIRRTYAVQGTYQLALKTEITNLTDATQSHKLELSTWHYVEYDEEKGKLFQQSPWVATGICEHGGEVERRQRGDMWREATDAGTIGFSAIDNLYFVQALLPKRGTQAECHMKARALPQGALYRSSLVYQADEVEPGRTATYETRTYFGPKDHDRLAAIDPDLAKLVDFGFFAPLCRVLLHVLKFFQGFVINWGIAIILLTISVKLLLYPLSQKSFKSMREMQRIKPLIDGLNARYSNDKEKRNQAMMELYKTHKINPFGGCLPLLVQMPIGLALYTTLWRAIELYHVPFALYWTDLSAPDPYFILPLVLGVTMFIQQKITPSTMDPAQQKMMLYVMPIMFTAFMLFLPVGLTLYILTNTLLTIAQQQLMYRQHPLPAVAATAVRPSQPAPESPRASRPRSARRRS